MQCSPARGSGRFIRSCFCGLSAEALGGRIADCDSRLVITADEGLRGGKRVPLKHNVDGALSIKGTECVKHVLVVRRTGAPVSIPAARSLVRRGGDAAGEDLRSRGDERRRSAVYSVYLRSTGQPKGVLTTSGGYLVYAAFTHETVFDLRDDDVYWATADIGWVTGHSYIVYGPLANGATTVMFEGVPSYPDSGRFWQVVDKPQGDDILLIAHGRHPLADAGRREAGESLVPPNAAPAWIGGRAHQPGGVGVVPSGGGRSSMSDRRHLVADGDWRHPGYCCRWGAIDFKLSQGPPRCRSPSA